MHNFMNNSDVGHSSVLLPNVRAGCVEGVGRPVGQERPTCLGPVGRHRWAWPDLNRRAFSGRSLIAKHSSAQTSHAIYTSQQHAATACISSLSFRVNPDNEPTLR